MNFRFMVNDKDRSVQHSFDADSLDEIINEFEMFLKGAGFHLDGRLELVDEDVDYDE